MLAYILPNQQSFRRCITFSYRQNDFAGQMEWLGLGAIGWRPLG